MLHIDQASCKKCGQCIKNCPIGAISDDGSGAERLIQIADNCVECNICRRICRFGAVKNADLAPDAITCGSCSVGCKIPVGGIGACKRYTNESGQLLRNRALVLEGLPQKSIDGKITAPVVTAVGAGTNYPCIRPSPFIVSECRDGVDVVTTVTEAPLSYSGLILKLDTNTHIGEEGSIVYREGLPVGLVHTEEYGSKMIAIGGANRLTGSGGFVTARTICELANGEEVELSVAKKTNLRIKAGSAPIIDGAAEKKMRLGCGSATVGLFAKLMKESVDECIVIDHHVIGLLTEHRAGKDIGLSWSGVIPNARKSTPGRYFGEQGEGIGGTTFTSPRDAIASVDMSVAKTPLQVLVVNTTGEIAALFEVGSGGDITEVPMSEGANNVARTIYDNCQESTVSILFSGGTGGSARGGVCSCPIAITEAVQAGRAKLTIGGADAFVYPGGGINFIVDTAHVVGGAFTWVPTPATVAPVEYTMTKEDYESIGGHMDQIRSVTELRGNDGAK